jgi:hypothetical protein
LASWATPRAARCGTTPELGGALRDAGGRSRLEEFSPPDVLVPADSLQKQAALRRFFLLLCLSHCPTSLSGVSSLQTIVFDDLCLVPEAVRIIVPDRPLSARAITPDPTSLQIIVFIASTAPVRRWSRAHSGPAVEEFSLSRSQVLQISLQEQAALRRFSSWRTGHTITAACCPSRRLSRRRQMAMIHMSNSPGRCAARVCVVGAPVHKLYVLLPQ